MDNSLYRPNTRIIPLPKWNNYHDFPTVSSLRHLVFFEETNGFSKVIRRIGKKIYICERSFFEWVEEQNNQQKTRPSQPGSGRRSNKSQ